MRKMLFVVALTILGAARVEAGPIPPACVAETANLYLALGTTGCTIGSWTLSNFLYTDITGITAGEPASTQMLITPLGGGTSAGFSGTPLIPWIANQSNLADIELQYVVTYTGSITSLYQSVTGTVTPSNPPSGGFDNITDNYCTGGTTTPPASGPYCNSSGTLYTDLYSNGTASNSVSFASVNSVAVLKDVNANATQYPGSVDTVTQFINCFNGTCSGTPPPTAEPSVLLMLGSGLLGLALLSVRRRRNRLA